MTVDTFAFISGFLFWYNVNTFSDVVLKMKRRVQMLLVPYILWNIIHILIHFILILLKQKQVILSDFTEYNLLYKIISWDASPHFWYIFMLMFWTVFAPVLYLCLKNKYFLISLFLLQLAYILYYRSSLLHSRFIYMIFTWGSIVGWYKKDFFNQLPRTKICCIFSILLFFIIPFFTDSTDNMLFRCLLYLLKSLCFLIMIFNIKTPYWLFSLFSYSFWLFAIHYKLDILVAYMFSTTLNNPLIVQSFSFCIVLFIGISSGYFLNRKCNFIYKILTGGR